jgi:hypothetical protein
VSAFTFTGEFAGFIRLVNGKRRMVLRTLDQELVLKVPRELRQELDGVLRVGGKVTVHGMEEPDGEHHQLLVSAIELTPDHRLDGTTLRICEKKNCWRQGGREVAHEIQKQLEAAGLLDLIRLKFTSCLDCCKHAPVIACNERMIQDCDTQAVTDLVSRLRQRLRPE